MSQGWWQQRRCGSEGVGQIIWEEENRGREEGKGGVRRLGAGDESLMTRKKIHTWIDVGPFTELMGGSLASRAKEKHAEHPRSRIN
jgi:hypothetical protein